LILAILSASVLAENQSIPQRIIVKFKSPPVNGSDKMTEIRPENFAEIRKLKDDSRVGEISRFSVQGNRAPREELFRNTFLMDLGEKVNPDAVVQELLRLDFIEYAEIDRLAEFYDIPDDPLFPVQWNLNNTGQEHYYVIRHLGPYNDTLSMTSGTPGADIEAGNVLGNPPDILKVPVAAILDSGVDINHPDLMDNIWTNGNEVAGDGIDNDHNGYVDDVHGWNFGDLLFGTGNNVVTDQDGHGTHCAGIVASVTNNTIGVAGVCPESKIMPVKIDPLPLVSSIAQGVVYAADNGADVINMSFGLAYPSPLLEEAMAYARRKGVVLCAASGNDGTEFYNYPAMSDLTIAVGATSSLDQVSSFSTYGTNIDICAPGEDIVSLRAAGTDTYASGYPQEPGVHIISTNYYIASGTSMACPHVVGAAAYLKGVSPGLSPDAVESILISSAEDFIDPYGAGWDLPGWDMYSGHGRLNLAKSLEQSPDMNLEISSPRPFEILSGAVNLTGTATGDDLHGYIVEYGTGFDPEDWIEIGEFTIPVDDGLLSGWNTSGMNGIYTIRVHSGSAHYHAVSVFVANGTQADFVTPADGENVYGFAEITIDAYSPNFENYTIEYKAAGEVSWQELERGSQPVFGYPVTYWNVDELAPGEYDLRLRMMQADKQEVVSAITVNVGSIFEGDNAWKVTMNALPTIVPNHADLDGDGNDEIIVGTENGVRVFSIDGTIVTEDIPVFPQSNFMVPPAVGDLNGDGKDDVVLMGYDPPYIYAYLSGGEHFRYYMANYPNVSEFQYTENSFPMVFLEDFDNDGRDDIFAHLPDAQVGFMIDSDGASSHVYQSVARFQPADLDGDGFDELYTYNSSFSELRHIDPDGDVLSAVRIEQDDTKFTCLTMTADDLDNDGDAELILFGYHTDDAYYLHVYDYNLSEWKGSPIELGLSSFIVPTSPVFADIDNNGTLEIISGFFDIDYSYLHVWNLDGSSYLPGSEGGQFATISHPGVLNMITVADITGDLIPEIIALANDDLFSIFPVQRIYAWDYSGRVVPGFPLVAASDISSGYRFTPAIGDFDKDGNVDFCMTTADNGLAYITRPGMAFQACASPVPHWRYNRKLNGIGPGVTPCIPTDIEEDSGILPRDFAIHQNYPNPFNPVTTISFDLPEREKVTLDVYNILGQKVATLHDGILPAGNHQLNWDTSKKRDGVATGVYFYRIQAGEFTETRKMLLLK